MLSHCSAKYTPVISMMQIDSGNVAVVFHADRYYLAYIQDIRDTEVLVDFHCATLTPTWISSQFIWPQMFIKPYPEADDIQVAVRDEPRGPLLFRPGRLISDRHQFTFRTVLYVEWISSSGITSRAVVQRKQIMDGDPVPERSLFSVIDDPAARPFVKLVLPLRTSCSLTTVKSADLFELRQLIKTLLHTKAQMAGFGYLGCYHNFHVTLATDSVIFIYWEKRAVIEHKQWANDDIIDVVTQWIVQLPLIKAGSNDEDRNDDLSVIEFVDLPDLILYQVLNDLEIHDFVNARRVCQRWESNLDNPNQLPHIRIDLRRRRQMFVCDEYVWDLGMLLDKLLHARVKTLTLLNVDKSPTPTHFAAISPLTSLALLRGVRFRVIALINGLSLAEISTEWGELFHCGHWSELLPITDRLIIRNYKLQRLIYPHYVNDPLQDPTEIQELLQGQGIEAMSAEKRPVPGLLIPHIMFDCRQPELENFHTLLKCIERHSPYVSDEDRSTALALYRFLLSEQLPERLLETRELAKKWKTFDPAGRFGVVSEAETTSLGSESPSKLFTYAVLSLFKYMS